jgi:hypothetical protein
LYDEQGEDEEKVEKDKLEPEPYVYIPYQPSIYANMKLKDAQDNEVFSSDYISS